MKTSFSTEFKFLVNKNTLNICDIFKCIYTSTCSLISILFAETEMMTETECLFVLLCPFSKNRPDVHSLCQHQSDAGGFKLALTDARCWVAKMFWLRANLAECHWIKHMDICMPANIFQVHNHLSWATTNRSDTCARQNQTGNKKKHTHDADRFHKIIS